MSKPTVPVDDEICFREALVEFPCRLERADHVVAEAVNQAQVKRIGNDSGLQAPISTQ